MKKSQTGAGSSDREAIIESLMRDYGTKVLHLAYFYVKDRHLAEDVAQEVFIKAYKHWGQFRGDSSPYTWLYRITINLCRDRMRTSWWRRVFPSEDPRVCPGVTPEEKASDDPEEMALNQLQHESMMELILSLPEIYREVIVLYYYQELSTSEIARVVGRNENTIKTRLFRARGMLKGALQKGGPSGESIS